MNRAADLVTILKTSGLGLIREMIAESPTAMARWRMLKLTVFTVLAFTRKNRRRTSFSAESTHSSAGSERGSLPGTGPQPRALPIAAKRNFSPQTSLRQHRTMDLGSHAAVTKPRRGPNHQTVNVVTVELIFTLTFNQIRLIFRLLVSFNYL